MEVVEYRTQYYTFLLAAVLRALSVAAPDIDIRHESAYSMSAEFTKDKMKMCAVSSVDEIRDVGSEVHDTRILSPLLCPIYPALSDVYLGTDFQLGGFDQACPCNFSAFPSSSGDLPPRPLLSPPPHPPNPKTRPGGGWPKKTNALVPCEYSRLTSQRPGECSAGYSSTPGTLSRASAGSRRRI